jgi:hypothetical protein
MTSHNLNQSGSRVEDKGFSPGDRVFSYKPPTQQEAARRGRKAKHLAHYHGPAIVQSQVQGRDRQYNITYNGKQFKKDISMLIPVGKDPQPNGQSFPFYSKTEQK